MQFTCFVRQGILSTMLMFFSLTGGCVRTTHPILKDEQVTTNDALVGKWISTDGKLAAELHAGENLRYKLDVADDGKSSHFVVRFGKIGDVNVAELSADAFAANSNEEYRSLLLPLYTLVVIEKTTPDLVLNGMSVDWLEKYIKAHPDEIDVVKISDQDDILNSSTEEFQTFFTSHLHDNGMLGKSQTFVHPGDPSTQPTK